MPLRAAARVRLAIAVLAWLAQALMPVVHAASSGGKGAASHAWCGDPATARMAFAILPPEVRAALGDSDLNADRLANCTLLCAAASGPPLPVTVSPTEALRAAGIESPPVVPALPFIRQQSPTPPAHAPPAFS